MKFMKTTSLILILLVMMFILMTACSNINSGYKDGVYTAQAAEFASSGWKETVEITIENSKLVTINWDAIYKDDSIPIRKKQYSKSGLYGMMAVGAVAEWYDQAVAAEQFVLEKGIDALTVNQDGYTDVVSSCTIHVIEFEKLLRECLEQAKK